MKKITLLVALTAIAVASCQKPEAALSVSEQFTASVESFDSQTKTSMTAERSVVWSQNDRLAIFQGSTLANEYKVADASVGQVNGTFSRVIEGGSNDFYAGTELPCNVAFYPYSADLSLTGVVMEEGTVYKVNGVELPTEQIYEAGSFGNGAFPMAAVTETLDDHNLNFKNILGALKLQIKGTQTVKSITVTGKNDEVLSGAAVVTVYANNLTPAITMTATDEASKSVTLNCGDGVQLSESTATDFIIALPPVLFSQGFTVTVTDSANETYEVSADVANTVLRSSILTMPAFTLGQAPENEEDDDSGVKVLDIAFDKTSLTLAPSTLYSIIAMVLPATADDNTLTWSSDSPSVATVDQSGVVTAVSDGTATITAVAVGGVSESCTVNVISLPVLATATADYKDEYGVNHGKGIAIGGTVWAPVNCGYKAPVKDQSGNITDKGYPYGKLYQWGRKYGQGYSLYSDTEPLIYPECVSATIGQDASMAGYFFTSSDSYDWVESRDDAIWNSGTEDAPVKTVNDPCPSGWRVPTYRELLALINDYSDWTTKDGQGGYYFSGVSTTIYDTYPLKEDKTKVFFPAAGYRDRNGDADDRGYAGRYWSSSPYYDLVRFLRFSSTVSMYNGSDRAYGYSVRCVQE